MGSQLVSVHCDQLPKHVLVNCLWQTRATNSVRNSVVLQIGNQSFIQTHQTNIQHVLVNAMSTSRCTSIQFL